MSLGKKLNLLVLLVVLCLVVSTSVTLVNLKKIDGNVDEALDERVEKIRIVDEIRVNMGMQGLYVRSLFIANTAANQELLEEYADNLDSNINALDKMSLTPEAEKLLENIKQANEEFNENYPIMLKALNNGDVDKATELIINEIKVANLKILESSNAILAIQDEALQSIGEQADNSISSSEIISVILVIASIVLAIFVMYFIKKGIVRPFRFSNECSETDFEW